MNNLYIFGITSAKGGIELLMKQIIFDIATKHPETKIHIVTSYSNIAFEDAYKQVDVDIIKIPSRSEKHAYKNSLKNIIASLHKDDVAYLNIATYCNWTLFKQVKNANCKIIVHGHNANTSNIIKKVLHVIGRVRFANVGYKIAVSEQCNRFMFGGKADEIIDNGIDSKLFKFDINDRRNIRKEYGIDDNKIVVGSLGRISKEKNSLYLVKKAKDFPNYLFMFIGGFMNKKYEAKIRKAASPNCIFTGEAGDSWTYLSALDAMVVPSKMEGFGLVFVESLTNGLPTFCLMTLYNKLSSIIKNNKEMYAFDSRSFTEKKLQQSNFDRNVNKVGFINTYDIVGLLSKIERVIYHE